MKQILFFLLVFFPASGFAKNYPVTRAETPFSGSRFYVPNDNLKHTAVVMLHGSEGGSEPFIDSEANILATQGYAVLVFCYFDCKRGLNGPRQTLQNVETLNVLKAVEWLRKQTLNDGKVVVYGFSRGAELTMIVGSLNMNSINRPNALIAHSPSDVFVGPWNWSWREPACWLCKKGIGQCSRTSPKSDYQWNPPCGADDPTKINFSQSAWLENGAPVKSGTRIEIEKYDGPILITVGEKDEVWPVEQTKKIERKLIAAGRKLEVHYFPNQGHVFHGSDETARRQLVLDFIQRAQ